MATVLIATGDSGLFDVMAAEISGERHRVLWATDGKDAYDVTLMDMPDLLALDPALPVFNAFETCRLLRGDPSVPHDLPIFLLTDEEADPRQLEKAQFTGVFSKTHNVHSVREWLAAYLPPQTMP